MAKTFKNFLFLVILFVLLSTQASFAQLTGTKNIPGDYATLEAAITDLNAQGVGGGGVTLNVVAANPQSAPVGGYVIGGTGSLVLTTTSASNPVIITGNSNTVTASGSLVAGTLNDGIFKLIGADYITISGFTILENPANLTTTAASNNMTEWGVALLYESLTNGAKNNTITNNVITLGATYQNAFGIYSNVMHSPTAPTTAAGVTTVDGSNSNNTYTLNTISGVNIGIALVGSTTTAAMDLGATVNQNTITSFGISATFSAFASVSTSINGIYFNNNYNFTANQNSVTSSVGGVTGTGTIRGIYNHTSGTIPTTGTYSRAINNNSISIRGGNAANILHGISMEGASTVATVTFQIDINNNTFSNFGHTVAATGAIVFINQLAGAVATNINGNIFDNMTVNTTGNVTFINNNISRPANSITSASNNAIQTAFSKTGSGGTVRFYDSFGTSGATGTENCNDNNFSNVTLTGTTALDGWRNADGATSTPFGPSKKIMNNTFSNITMGTGAITSIITCGYGNPGDTAYITNNTVSNITGGGAITIFTSPVGYQRFFGNTISGVTTTGASTINCMTFSGGVTQSFYNNKVYNITANNASGIVNGVNVSTIPTTINIYNNFIGDLKAPLTSSTSDAIKGLNFTGTTATTNINVSFNTIYLNATSAGANFSTTCVLHTTSATATSAALNMRNNILVNLSTPNGTGVASAYRRSSTTLTNYGSVSNNNLLYAGTPAANKVLFYDGTNLDQTISDYKTRVTPRDAQSVTENPNFRSTTGSDATFLHIDSTIASQIESGGITVAGITADYDGVQRYPNVGYPNNPSYPAYGPDMGADEFGGIWADLSGPAISYTALSNTGNTGNRTLAVTITDPSGVATGANGPRLYYKKTTDGAYVYDDAPSVAGNVYTFTINNALLGGGSVTPGDVIQYYAAAQDLNANVSTSPSGGSGVNPPGTTPPGAPNSYTINQPPLSGDYTVGTVAFNRASGLNLKLEKFTRTVVKDIEVSSDAPAASNQKTAAVTNEVLSSSPKNTLRTEVTEDFYALAENGKIYEGPQVLYTDNSAIYATITAAVADLNSRGVGGPTRFLLTDASYSEAAFINIAITGDLPTATNTVTFKPAPGVTSTVSVNSTSPVFVVGSNYVTIDGSNTDGGTTRNLTLTNNGAGASSGVAFFTGTNDVCKNIIGTTSAFTVGFGIVFSAATNGTVQNCDIQKTLLGIQSQSNTAGMIITENSIGSVDSLSKTQNGGIIVLSTSNYTVSGNTIVGVSRNATASTSGISVGHQGAGFISPTPGVISANRIQNVKHSGFNSAAYGAFGIQLASTDAATDLTIKNNVISDIYSQGDGGTTGVEYCPHGIYILSGGGYKIYNNSINLFGAITDPDGASTMKAGGITVAAVTGAGNLDIRNNISINNQTYSVPLATKKSYSIISLVANTSFTNIDYNDYYVTGADGILGYLTSDRTSITQWRTATGKDVSSISWDPGFTSSTDLMPILGGGACWGVNGTAYPLAAVATDFAGNSRSTTIAGGATDMGAYEFTPASTPPTAVQTIVSDGTYDYAIGGKIFASIVITGYTADAAAFDISIIHYSGINPPGATTQQYANSYDSVWVSNGSFSAASYEIRLYANDNNMRNIATPTNIILAKSNDGGTSWNPSPGTANGYTAGSPGYGYASGLTSFSLFAITSTDSPLPVELSSFTSVVERRNVELKWSTASEQNNSGFDIERKTADATTWTKIGNVQGAGTTTEIKNYNFQDRNLSTGKYNYRLKQVDYNGNFKYYQLTNLVDVGVPAKFDLSQNYPNPFNPSTKINYDLPFDSKVSLKLFDMTGREVAVIVNAAQTAGYYTVQFNGSNLASGIYFYNIVAEGGNASKFVTTKKMVLVK